jgi:hypothetical protein
VLLAWRGQPTLVRSYQDADKAKNIPNQILFPPDRQLTREDGLQVKVSSAPVHDLYAVRCEQVVLLAGCLVVQREFGDQNAIAETAGLLGDACHAAGDFAAARDAWHETLGILDDFHSSEAEQIRAKLKDLDAGNVEPPPPSGSAGA